MTEREAQLYEELHNKRQDWKISDTAISRIKKLVILGHFHADVSIPKSIFLDLFNSRGNNSLKLLDIGCGKGDDIYKLFLNFLEYGKSWKEVETIANSVEFLGIDFYEEPIHNLQRIPKKIRSTFSLHELDIDGLFLKHVTFEQQAFPLLHCSEKFDIIVDSAGAFAYFRDPLIALLETIRLLREQGVFCYAPQPQQKMARIFFFGLKEPTNLYEINEAHLFRFSGLKKISKNIFRYCPNEKNIDVISKIRNACTLSDVGGNAIYYLINDMDVLDYILAIKNFR